LGLSKGKLLDPKKGSTERIALTEKKKSSKGILIDRKKNCVRSEGPGSGKKAQNPNKKPTTHKIRRGSDGRKDGGDKKRPQ